jgi:NAD(P)-dependent dehydrogenase (short-subunit alcohol dehydrogenase family)
MKNKMVHVITGASKGIGRATAIKLSQEDPNGVYVLIARDLIHLNETKQLMSPYSEVVIKQLDLSDSSLIIEFIRYIGNKFGRIDFLVNIAGFVNPKSLLETSIENFELTYKINVFAIFVLTKETVRFMKDNGGKILNVASTAGLSSRPGWSAYASSKAAVISFTKTMSDELEEYGIKSYAISPGRCATDLRKLLAPEEDPTTIMQPQEVAQIISNLLGENGNNLDGQNIIIRKQL